MNASDRPRPPTLRPPVLPWWIRLPAAIAAATAGGLLFHFGAIEALNEQPWHAGALAGVIGSELIAAVVDVGRSIHWWFGASIEKSEAWGGRVYGEFSDFARAANISLHPEDLNSEATRVTEQAEGTAFGSFVLYATVAIILLPLAFASFVGNVMQFGTEGVAFEAVWLPFRWVLAGGGAVMILGFVSYMIHWRTLVGWRGQAVQQRISLVSRSITPTDYASDSGFGTTVRDNSEGNGRDVSPSRHKQRVEDEPEFAPRHVDQFHPTRRRDELDAKGPDDGYMEALDPDEPDDVHDPSQTNPSYDPAAYDDPTYDEPEEERDRGRAEPRSDPPNSNDPGPEPTGGGMWD